MIKGDVLIAVRAEPGPGDAGEGDEKQHPATEHGQPVLAQRNPASRQANGRAQPAQR